MGHYGEALDEMSRWLERTDVALDQCDAERALVFVSLPPFDDEDDETENEDDETTTRASSSQEQEQEAQHSNFVLFFPQLILIHVVEYEANVHFWYFKRMFFLSHNLKY